MRFGARAQTSTPVAAPPPRLRTLTGIRTAAAGPHCPLRAVERELEDRLRGLGSAVAVDRQRLVDLVGARAASAASAPGGSK